MLMYVLALTMTIRVYLVHHPHGKNHPERVYPTYPSPAARSIGLTLDPPRGVSAIELNQGDTKSGRIARSDVARVCVESIYRWAFSVVWN